MQVTDEMVEAACAEYARTTGHYVEFSFAPIGGALRFEPSMKMRAALTAALSKAEPPISIRNEEAGFTEFVNEDVPYIVREIDGPVAILLEMETRRIIGYRVFDALSKAEEPAVAVKPLSYIEIAQAGFAAWANKPHNAKWLRKIDGTPIPNDLVVCIADAFRSALVAPSEKDEPTVYTIEHDGFTGTVVGSYITREGKRGGVLQQVGTRVVHVYGEKWLTPSEKDALSAQQGVDRDA